MRKNHSVSIFWLSVLAIFVIGYMILSIQNITRASFVKNEGIKITTNGSGDIEPTELKIVNQTNASWAMKIMCSDINLRICEYGSQLCCMSSLYELFDIYMTPDKLYDRFIADGLYSEDGSDIFCDAPYEILNYKYSLAYESPRLNVSTTFDSTTVISLLKDGIPVMVRTTHPLVERFWVVVTGVIDGEFVIMDPLSEEYGTLSTYENEIFEIMYFTE